MIIETVDFSYGTESARQIVRCYRLNVSQLKAAKSGGSLVFIHGGAWRDPLNTCDDFTELVGQLDSLLQPSSRSEHTAEVLIFSLDYRLSPEVKHPQHLIDVLLALGAIRQKCGIDQVTLCGHSVGATLITQILDYKEILRKYHVQLDALPLPQVSGAIYLDGIYNIPAMLKEYPEYLGFVEEAFNGNEYSTHSNLISCNAQPGSYNIKHTVIHSTVDELLSLQQPKLFIDWLQRSGAPQVEHIYDDFGKHNDVYSDPAVARLVIEANST